MGLQVGKNNKMGRFTPDTRGSLIRPILITSFSAPFFCVVNASNTSLVRCSSESDVVVRFNCLIPTESWTSPRMKGMVSDLESVDFPGRRRKKNAIMIMSAAAHSLFVSQRQARRVGGNVADDHHRHGFHPVCWGIPLLPSGKYPDEPAVCLWCAFRHELSSPIAMNGYATARR